ncbi:hypothetical protein MCOR32_000896 [Pyricularia oryzae]|nr:hypothetical protein MCOR34_011301 [Pyricularia oryzae]KAI6386599.1 hypothetical protein MCOR32_000896 [Pyricularia oryzae]KAI6396148.1 hypothetical protein MCOR20_010020 [Pyricularia oryzae]
MTKTQASGVVNCLFTGLVAMTCITTCCRCAVGYLYRFSRSASSCESSLCSAKQLEHNKGTEKTFSPHSDGLQRHPSGGRLASEAECPHSYWNRLVKHMTG